MSDKEKPNPAQSAQDTAKSAQESAQTAQESAKSAQETAQSAQETAQAAQGAPAQAGSPSPASSEGGTASQPSAATQRADQTAAQRSKPMDEKDSENRQDALDSARAVKQSDQTRDQSDEDRRRRIEERAHQLWEMEGRPEGRSEQHWRQAEVEIAGQPGAMGDHIGHRPFGGQPLDTMEPNQGDQFTPPQGDYASRGGNPSGPIGEPQPYVPKSQGGTGTSQAEVDQAMKEKADADEEGERRAAEAAQQRKEANQ